jgi:hypothetical protein
MIKRLRGLGLGLGVGFVAAALLSSPIAAQSPVPPAPIPGQQQGAASPPAAEQPPPSNPVCVRLEGQMASLNRGGGDPARAEQIKRPIWTAWSHTPNGGAAKADFSRSSPASRRNVSRSTPRSSSCATASIAP